MTTVDQEPVALASSWPRPWVGTTAPADPVVPGGGGPAGNVILTAWTGLVLLALSVAELLTLFDVRGLISWHVAIGVLLIPPALLKTGTTTWRMVQYYRGDGAYQQSGPPPLLLRLGPLVVLSTLGLLATGVLLVLLGEETSRHARPGTRHCASTGSPSTRRPSPAGPRRPACTCSPASVRRLCSPANGPPSPEVAAASPPSPSP